MPIFKGLKMKIAIIEPIGITSEEIHSELANHTVMECDSRNWSDEQLIEHIKDAHIISLTNRPLSAAVIHAATELKFIAVAFAGIDHIDMDAANKKTHFSEKCCWICKYRSSRTCVWAHDLFST